MDLFTPIQIGKLQLDNRIIFGPHATGFEIDTDSPRAAERYGRYLARRVRGGAGLVFGANPGVDYHSGNGRVEFTIGYGPHRWRVGERGTADEHRFREYFCSLARIVHAAGGRIFTQLFMGAGNQTYGYPYISRPDYVVLSPSATANAASGMMAREIDPQEIETMISGAGQIAAVIQACEIDGIEFHSHAGYLMSAFLSPASNRRADEYGGSLENRVRLLLRCLQQIRLSVGPNYPLGVRYSAFENIAGGLPLEEGIEIGRILDASRLVDEISVVGAPATAGLGIPDMRYPSGFLRVPTARVRSALAYRTPIACVGRIDTPELAERIIAEGSADLIVIVRSLIADPDFPVKARTRRHNDIRRCPAANDGCVALSLETRVGSIRCTVNPEAGHEQQYERSIAAAQIRRVMVIGGGPAGLKAAEQAALRGHYVVLCEKEAYLGGQVALQARVASRAQEAVVIEDLVRNIQALRVEIRLATEVNAEYVCREAPFAVVLASGSRPVRTGYTNLTPELDGLPGADLPFVLTEDDVLRGSPVGPRVLVVEDSSGGDKRAPLIVEHLLDTGHGVDVLTTADRLGQHVSVFDSPQMLRRLYSMGMRIRSNVAVKCIRELSVIVTHCHTLETEELGGFDNIVLVIGRRSSRELFRSLRGAVPELYEIGDAVSPRTVTAAVLEGFRAGRAI